MTKSKLNIVYDKWDGDNPIPNGKVYYPNHYFWDIEDFVLTYLNAFSESRNGISIYRYKIQDVYLNPNQKFYYFIGHANANISDMMKDGFIITDEIKSCLINCSNFNLVFFSHHDSDDESGFISLNETDLPKKQIYIINNNYKLNEYIHKHNSQINVYNIMYLPVVVSFTLVNFGGFEFNPERKEKFFMCFNRSQKLHRFSLLMFMLKNNFLDDTNWSLIPHHKVNYNSEMYDQIFEEGEIKNYTNEIKVLNDINLKMSDYEKSEFTFNENNEIIVLNPKHKNVLLPPEIPTNYINSYVNVVTETKFFDAENVVQISEKSFKPFFYYQFPMILATHHHIKSMKEKYDFDFFDDLIDHSYDNEPNQKKRFSLFVNELKRLHNQKEKLIGFYRHNRERFERNKNKVIEIMNNTSDFDFFQQFLN